MLTLFEQAMHAAVEEYVGLNISSKNFVMKIIHDENYLYVGTKGGGLVKIAKQSGEQTVLKRADGRPLHH